MVQKSIAAAAAAVIGSAIVCAAPARADFAFRFNGAALAVPAGAKATYERLGYEAQSRRRSATIRGRVRKTAAALIDNVRLVEARRRPLTITRTPAEARGR